MNAKSEAGENLNVAISPLTGKENRPPFSAGKRLSIQGEKPAIKISVRKSTCFSRSYKTGLSLFFRKSLFFAVKRSTFAPALKEASSGKQQGAPISHQKTRKVDTLSYKTQSAKKEEVERKWYVVDAEGEVVGRLCSRIAHVLRGKHKPSYTPHIDTGDYVVVINADKIRLTGSKMDQKEYVTFSGYPGGQKKTTAKELLAKKPHALIENGVKGMLPKNRLGRAMFKKLFVYEGPEHPHQAQKPEAFNF